MAGMVLATFVACGGEGAKSNNDGNDAFERQEYEAALGSYDRASESSPDLAEPHYNTGNVRYRQKEYGDAQASYEQSLIDADEGLAQDGLFNLGNSLYQSDELEAAIDSYKEALRIEPGDLDAKYNLELALRRLQQGQQEQEQQGQPGDGEEAEQQPDDQGDQEGDQEPQDQEEQEGGQDPQDPQEGSRGDEQQQAQDQQSSPTETTELTEEQARQLLSTVGDETETLQHRLQRTVVGGGRPPEQDW